MRKGDQGSFSSPRLVRPADPELVARRAYELYELRGCEAGHEMEDWLQAEAELAAARADGANTDDLGDRLDGVAQDPAASPSGAPPSPRKGNGNRRPQRQPQSH
jgi:hypothetical protein